MELAIFERHVLEQMLIASVVEEPIEVLIFEFSHRGKTELDRRPGWPRSWELWSFRLNPDYLRSRRVENLLETVSGKSVGACERFGGERMSERKDALFWNGKLVGVIRNSKIDMFDLYGSWTPTTDTDLYRQFLEQAGMEGGARVEIGKIGSAYFGRVELYPDDEIGDEINVKTGVSE